MIVKGWFEASQYSLKKIKYFYCSEVSCSQGRHVAVQAHASFPSSEICSEICALYLSDLSQPNEKAKCLKLLENPAKDSTAMIDSQFHGKC